MAERYPRLGDFEESNSNFLKDENYRRDYTTDSSMAVLGEGLTRFGSGFLLGALSRQKPQTSEYNTRHPLGPGAELKLQRKPGKVWEQGMRKMAINMREVAL
jgi:hypothetical protein